VRISAVSAFERLSIPNQVFNTEITMLKFSEAASAKDRVAALEIEATRCGNELIEQCNQLHTLRSEVGRALVHDFESYVNALASRPKQYDRTFELYHLNLNRFDHEGKAFSDKLEAQLKATKTESGATVGLGAAAGAATAFGAPTAAMAIATTFGTASTGTAISTLSGAAATKAALAWLGGGALAAGGGGMSAGSALLALAGPVGLALAGTTLLAGAGWAAFKNRETIEKAAELEKNLSESISILETQLYEASSLYSLTVEHTHSLRTLFTDLVRSTPRDYADFSARHKELLGAAHNNVLALTRLLKMKPGELVDLTAPVEDSELKTDEPYRPNFVMGSQVQGEKAFEPLTVHVASASLGGLASFAAAAVTGWWGNSKSK
jgi:hypothetical protein